MGDQLKKVLMTVDCGCLGLVLPVYLRFASLQFLLSFVEVRGVPVLLRVLREVVRETCIHHGVRKLLNREGVEALLDELVNDLLVDL